MKKPNWLKRKAARRVEAMENKKKTLSELKPVAVLIIGLYILTPLDVLAKRFDFVGIESCSCHTAEIKSWTRSVHKKAFSLLSINRKKKRNKAMKKAGLDPGKDYSTDKKCLECHTTGYKKKGGFVSIEETPELAGVGCEACHGPGEEYRELHKDKKENFTRAEAIEAGEVFPSKDNTCIDCHISKDAPFTPEIDEKYEFDLKEKLKKEKTFHKVYPLVIER